MTAEEDVYYDGLYSEYGSLLTDKQRSVYELSVWSDLSLYEIAEINGVTKQSVADCLSAVKKRLETFEEKLGVVRLKRELAKAVEDCGDERAKENMKRILSRS